jgi:enamine deaminase RidA (YjgF/YER057c/UK114 family)
MVAGDDEGASAPPPAEQIGGRLLFPTIAANPQLDTIEEQMGEALGRLDARLAAAGTDRRSLLTVHIWLRDMACFDRMTAVWNAWIGSDAPPSRSCVSGGSLDPDLGGSLVELVASAALPVGAGATPPAPIERYGVVSGAGRPTMCLALAYEDWFTVCTLAGDGSADIAGQTAQILDAFDAYLAEAGVDRADILTIDVWLKRVADDAVVRGAVEEWLAPAAEWPAAASSCVRADMAREDKLVEIRITATRRTRPAPAASM